MKRISFLFLLVLAVFAGCKKEVDEVEEKLFSFPITHEKQFTLKQTEVDFAYDNQNMGSIPFPVSGVSSSSEADFQKNNTTTNLVKNVKLEELILTVPDNSADDFTFLEKMDVYIAMEDGTDQVLMAYNRSIPATSPVAGVKYTKLVFQPSGNSMDKYVKAGKYMLVLQDTRLRRKVTANMDVTAKLTFTVTASPLK